MVLNGIFSFYLPKSVKTAHKIDISRIFTVISRPRLWLAGSLVPHCADIIRCGAPAAAAVACRQTRHHHTIGQDCGAVASACGIRDHLRSVRIPSPGPPPCLFRRLRPCYASFPASFLMLSDKTYISACFGPEPFSYTVSSKTMLTLLPSDAIRSAIRLISTVR